MFKTIRKKILNLSAAEIFIVLTVVSLVIFIIKFFGFKTEWRTIRIEVIKKNWTENYDPYGYRVPFWLSDKIKVNQTEKDKSGKTIARLINLENYERGGEEAELYLMVQVKATFNKRTGQYLFKEKFLDLGAAIELNLNNIIVEGQIVDTSVPLAGYLTKEFIVTARGRNLESWTIAQVAVKDKMINRANNEAVAEILNFDIQDPTSENLKIDNLNNLQIVENKRKDLVITAKIKCYQQDGRWYFSGHQNLKVGNNIYIYTDKVNLYSLEVQDIKEI